MPCRGARSSCDRISPPRSRVQTQDDISVSTVVPASRLGELPEELRNPQRQNGAELRSSTLPTSRRCDPSRHGPTDRKGSHVDGQLSFRTSSPSLPTESDLSSSTLSISTSSHRRCATSCRRRLGMVTRTSCARPIHDSSTECRRRIRATYSFDRILPIRSGSTQRRWRRGSSARRPPSSPVHMPVQSVIFGRRNNPADSREGHRRVGGLQPAPLPGAP